MINRKLIKKAIGATTAAAMVLPVISGAGFNASAQSAQSSVTKNESVYVNADSQGNAESETVSDWLHSDTADISVKDISNLSGIKNINGNQKPVISGNSVTWNMTGNDLYYSGSTSKSLPVSMKIDYYLNGNPISPKEIGGKSGKIEMKISFKNNDVHNETINGKVRQVYTPFVCAAVVNLPKKQFSNVSASVGKVQDDGVNQMLCFVNLPGLKDDFSMIKDKVKTTDELDITADAKSFELGPVMAMAMPATDLNSLKNSNDLNDLSGKLDQLYNAGDTLRTATGTLSSSEAEFAAGMQQLYDGVTQANSSYSQIQSGAQQLKDGVDDPNSIALLQSSLGQLAAGAQALSSGTAQLNSSVNNNQKLANLMNQLPTVSGKVGELNGGAQKVSAGLSQLKAQLSQSSAALGGYQKQISDLNSGAGTLAGALSKLQSGLGTCQSGAGSLEDGASKLSSGAQQYVGTADSLLAALRSDTHLFNAVVGELTTGHPTKDQQTALQTELAFLYDSGNATETATLTQMQIDPKSLTAVQQNFSAGGSGIVSGAKQLSSGCSNLSSGLSTINQNMPSILSGANQLYAGTQELNKQMNPSNSSNSSDYTLYDKIVALNTGVGQLSDGASQVAAGTDKLNTAIASSDLSGIKDSVSQLQNGISALNTGAGQLSSGLSAANTGAGSLTTLKNGIDSLASGINLFQSRGLSPLLSGASKLNSASGQLASGASQLNTGMNEFFNQGISKCKSSDIDNVNDALKVKDAAIDLADSYSTFSGTGDGIKSNVKFILKTDEIKAPTVQTQKAKTAVKTNKNFFEKIADWFKNTF